MTFGRVQVVNFLKQWALNNPEKPTQVEEETVRSIEQTSPLP